jgi:hypothetical protein
MKKTILAALAFAAMIPTLAQAGYYSDKYGTIDRGNPDLAYSDYYDRAPVAVLRNGPSIVVVQGTEDGYESRRSGLGRTRGIPMIEGPCTMRVRTAWVYEDAYTVGDQICEFWDGSIRPVR